MMMVVVVVVAVVSRLLGFTQHLVVIGVSGGR
jgi:hypothetical protein